MNSKRRLSQNLSGSTNKLRLNSINKILKIDSKAKKQRKESLGKCVSRVVLSELIKNTSADHSRLPDFREFLRDEDNVETFREFLKSQYCHENLEFYLACEKYRRLDAGNIGYELVKFMAAQIFNDYLSQNARQPVNIDHTCIKRIEQSLKQPYPDLFEEAKDEVCDLMESDCFPRFCKNWKLDKDLAQKIINSTLRDRNDTTNVTDVSTTTSRSSTVASRQEKAKPLHDDREQNSTPTSLSSVRNLSRNTSSSSSYQCNPECPYFSMSRLPCRGHRSSRSERRPQPHCDLDQHMDLKRIHKLPDSLRPKRAPPPPPLPPKLDSVPSSMITQSKAPGDKDYPYVGKVFHV